MIIPYQGFIAGTYQGRSRRAGSERCINLIPEPAPPNAFTKNPTVYKRRPGLKTWCAAGTGPIRSMYQENDRAWVVSGAELYEVSAGASATLLGNVGLSSLPAGMASNGSAGHQLMVVSNGKGYIYDLTSGAFAQITDVDFPSNAQGCVYLDSFFFTFPFNTRQFAYSASFDGTSWAAGDIGQKELTIDNIRAIVETHEELWLIGPKNIEPWQPTGDGSQPFAPINGVKIEHGIGPVGSLTKVNNTIAFLQADNDGNRIAVMANAYELTRFSTFAIEERWADYQRVDDAVAWTYQMSGHTFYIVSFPTAGETWAYDFITGYWHELAYLNPATGQQEAHLGAAHMLAFDTHLVGSRVDGTIYQMDPTFCYDADTKPIRRERVAPHIFKSQGEITINRFQVDVDSGIANAAGQGSDPRLMMKSSIDGGETFSDELFASTGKVGMTLTECGWDQLGQGPDWVFSVASSEPINDVWTGASLDAEGDA